MKSGHLGTGDLPPHFVVIDISNEDGICRMTEHKFKAVTIKIARIKRMMQRKLPLQQKNAYSFSPSSKVYEAATASKSPDKNSLVTMQTHLPPTKFMSITLATEIHGCNRSLVRRILAYALFVLTIPRRKKLKRLLRFSSSSLCCVPNIDNTITTTSGKGVVSSVK